MTQTTPEPGVDTGVGSRRSRVGAAGKVRGQLRHVADRPHGGCAHVAVHRSTRPHARITSVDVSEAAALDGVEAVVTGAALYKVLGDRMFTGPAFSDQPPLAVDRVRYVGEPVVAVLARDVATAREAAELVYVEYEDLEPIYDVADALAERAFVHDALRPSVVFGDLRHLSGKTETNIAYEYNLKLGDPESAATQGTSVGFEFWAPPVHHVAIELPATIGWVDADRLELYSTTQTPSYVRQSVADMLGLPLSHVRIRVAPLGGSFGAKMYDRLEPLIAALAWLYRREVRMVASREEAFLLTTRHGAGVISSMSADADGNLTSATADVRYDTGAYADVGPRITAKSGMIAAGPYKIPNVAIRSRCIYTNKPSAGPFRGFGVPQVTWSHETLIDELARARGEDPAAFRRRNLLREGDESYMGTVMHSADFVGCLDAVTEAIGWDTPLDRGSGRWRRGRGVAVGIKAVLTPTVANAVLQLNQDGSATLMISTVDMGQGSDTIMPQIVAEVLSMDAERIRVVAVDTDVTPYDTITAGSRSTYHTGNAVRGVAERMRERLLDLAAKRAGGSSKDLKLTADGVLNTASGEVYRVSELIHEHFGARGATMTEEFNYTTSWQPYDKETGRSAKATEHWFAGAVAVQLLVDRWTGRARVEHLAVAGDVGRAINPALVEQQLAGSAIMGLGHALFDELVFDQGQMLNGTLLDYQLPSVKDLPGKLTPIIIESPHASGPFGAKGVGETGIIPIAPAVANAVRDAVGVRITRLPLSPERVLQAMDEAGVEK
ncbi:xanthine dehydrogenase family protein molybdopterin-binding subunit [Micromonospora sp. U21]|uniref:xanthine dehydrogenase family protein molybdopterin-binding subunit n=1 Tax=Micromonospora sp. U21 TaxID=2824899 RepID=UPI001B38068E|nr:xanthine dehydrogenase family protein molybdopterin-binding subunit [Micromonospora sp. U21]MBQ0904998.1 xanthine dehydrogenase family protein molybdopterin-binding subunit [Micromonospora sp. U21]